MQRTYQYRLYPTPQQRDALNMILRQSCLLYNEALEHRRHVYKHAGQSVSYPAQWRRFKEDRKERVEDFGLLNATSVLHRAVPEGCLKQVVITRKAGDRWFVSFQGDDGCDPAPLKGGKAVGIDIGLSSLLAFSDGTLIDNPRWFRRSLKKLRRTQRALARKTRFSARWRKTKCQLETLHWKIGNQRRHFLHKLTRRLTDTFALIAVEDVSPSFMLANPRLALSASDASWHLFRSMLDYKAERAGCLIVEVEARYTSQACSGCGKIEKKLLSQRWHACTCGTELNRDVNAAVNILNKARCEPTEPNVEVVNSSVLRQKADAL